MPPLQRPLPYHQSPEASQESPLLSSRDTPQRAAKIPIPRLKRTGDDPAAAGSSNGENNKHRVTHACNWRFYASRHTADLATENRDAHSSGSRQRIPAGGAGQEDMVDGVEEDFSGTEYQMRGRQGSTESVDCINEDLNRTAASRATGFMGKNTEVNWLEQLRVRTEHPDNGQDESDDVGMHFGSGVDGIPGKAQKDSHPLSESTYHCDDMSLDVPGHLQAYELPPKDIADLLLSYYLQSVHPAFPIIGQTTFVKQYQWYWSNAAVQPGPLWLAILNLIFAIAARYSSLTKAEWSLRAEDAHTYFSRARLLGLGVDALLAHAELQRIQVTGLTSFYLMATNQINRAYAMNGIAVRQALSLGLNLRNQDPDLTDSSKEIRYRVWWAVVTTERTLSVMTGRPASFAASHCSAPLPIPLDEASFMLSDGAYQSSAIDKLRRSSTGESRSTDTSFSTPSSISSRQKSPNNPPTFRSPGSMEAPNVAPNMGLFFLHIAKLSNLSDDILKQLYRPSVLELAWASVQSIASKCHDRLERWRSSLPAIFDFTRSQQDREFARARMCLAFSYYSAMIITKRPFLCKMERKIPKESGRAKSIDVANAASCVFAAKAVVDMLPDQPDPVGMYQETPWWNMVHHLMQAVSVLMLELSLGVDKSSNSADQLLLAAEKTVRWLQAMAAEDMAAARAWKLSSELLQKIASRFGRGMNERLLWPEPPSQAVPMEAPMQDGLDTSDYYLTPSTTGVYTGYEPVTSWEPNMFTSYDNYLLGDDQSMDQARSHQWN
ncbi:MAG: hypothetical protein Q9180_002177 [Flavoplaca navasiana]